MKRLTILAAGLVVLAGCGDKDKDFDATGTFEATEVTVSAEQSGSLLRFALEEGDNVEAGREVGLIDTMQLWLKLQQADATKAVYQSQKPDMEKQIAATRQQLEKAKTEQRRYQELVGDGAAPSKMLDDATNQVKVLQRQLDAQVSSLNTQLSTLNSQLSTVDVQKSQLKLALSCALVHQPSVLFLDEPTTGVDPVSRKEFWDMLSMLKERQITIVASTPYLDEVRRCERVAFLSEGRLMGIDTPEVILERFKEVFNPAPPLSYGRGAGGEASPIISVSHLVKAFGSFHAVDDISFSVRRGEIFGFLGANGAGKTTAMHMLTGLNQPTSGTGRVCGYDIRTQYEDIKRHIGYMSQKFSLYEDLTVAENIRLFAGIYGMKDDEIARKTDDLLRRLKFEAHKNDLVGSLPLGWKQKLAFSVSIFHEPGVVFLDEPTGGVDPATRRQFWELIYDAAARGITVFVTTHYMDEAEYCDRISIMVDGKISAIGTPEELKRNLNQPDMDHVFTYLARQAKRD